MKIAVLSDIHSNHVALEACFAEIDRQAVDAVVYLGDYVSDCPFPQKTLSLVSAKARQYKSYFVKGNREEYLIDYHSAGKGDWSPGSGRGSLLYTYRNLSGRQIGFLNSMPAVKTIRFDGGLALTACHGSPISTREQLRPGKGPAEDYLEQMPTRYLLCGHTHRQYVYEYQGRTLLNPGSVGLQVDGRTEAGFAMLHYEHGELRPRLHRVAYDIERAVKEFETGGLCEMGGIWSMTVIRALQTGLDYPLHCLELARRLADGARIPPDWDIPEQYWRQAAIRLGII